MGAAAILLSLASLADLLASTPYKTAGALILLTSVSLAAVSGRLLCGLIAAGVSIYLYERLFASDMHPRGSVMIFTFFLALALALSQVIVRIKLSKEEVLADLERKQCELAEAAETAVRERASLELALVAGRMTAWEWTPETGYVWTHGFWSQLGFEEGEFDGPLEAILPAVHPDDRARFHDARIGLLEVPRYESFSYRILDADGKTHWVECRWQSFAGAGGEVERAFGIVSDISERHRVEQAHAELLVREQAARADAEQAHAHLLFLSQASELLSESLDLEETLASIVKVAIPTLADWFILDLVDEEGQFKRLTVVHGDPDKAADARRLTEFPPDLGSSEGAARVARTGMTVVYEPLTEEIIKAVATCAEHEQVLHSLGCGSAIQVGLAARGHTFGVITAMSMTPGRYSSTDVQLLEDVAGRIALAIDNAFLYGEVQRALAERGQTLAELNANIAAAPVGMAFVDRDLRYLRINDFLAKAGGAPIEEHLGRRPSEVIGPERGHGLEELLERVLASGEPLVEVAMNSKMVYGPASPEPERHWRISIYPVYGPNGTIQSLGIFAANVTEQALLEQQLLRAQKLEAVGLLAGGIAHDFNNVLTAISVSSDLLERNLPSDSALRREAGEIQRAAERASQLTKQLLAFSRRQVLQPRPLAVNDIVRDTEAMLRRLLSEQIELDVHLEENLGTVIADPSQIEQVIINLAVNARDAMSDGGTLTISTSNLSVRKPRTGTVVEIPAGEYVCLEVSDTGSGIDPQLLGQIFDPFFTTKEQGEGTGLGLATVYGIVAQSNGLIDVDTTPGEGSTFRMLLPLVDNQLVHSSVLAETPETSAAAGETILFVEDEEAVRMLVGSLLEQLGYRVLEAANGTDALALIGTSGAQIDLLLTDLVMPKMGGRELAEQLRSLLPGLRVLFISGHDDDPRLTDALAQPHTQFIEKPFTAKHLAQALRVLFDEEEK